MLFGLPLAPLSGLFLLAGGILLAVVWLTLRAGRDTPVTQWFLALLVVDTAWVTASIVPLEAATAGVAFAGEVLRVATSSASALVWLSFAIVYTGRGQALTRRRLAALAAPLAVHTLAFATNPLHGLSVRGFFVAVGPVRTTVEYAPGPVYAAGTLYGLAVTAVGLSLVAHTAVTDRDLYADQSLALFVGSFAPLAAALASLSGVVDVGVTVLTPAALPIAAVGYGYALFRTDLLKTSPMVATQGREVAIESLEEGFLIVDGSDRIVEANTAARDLLDATRLAGVPIADALPMGTVPQRGRRIVHTEDGTVLEVRITALDAQDGGEVGRVVILRDVTTRHSRRERLQVLNRVLRHNLRNGLNAVRLFARQIADDAARPETETAADRIRARTDDLLSVAENARRLERLLATEGTTDREPVALASLIERRLDRLSERATRPVEFVTDLPAECRIESHPAVLELVVGEVLENAVRHNDRPDPTVWVSVSAEETVRIEVADDGPGIPRQDREAVLSGTETSLAHASRLGLWIVRWGVRSLGGSFSIDDRSPTGTRVTLTVPRGEEADATPTPGTAPGRDDGTEADAGAARSGADATPDSDSDSNPRSGATPRADGATDRDRHA